MDVHFDFRIQHSFGTDFEIAKQPGCWSVTWKRELWITRRFMGYMIDNQCAVRQIGLERRSPLP